MSEVLQSFIDYFEKLTSSVPLLIAGFLIFILFVISGRWTTRAMQKMIKMDGQRARKRKILIRMIRWVFYIIGLSFALSVMGLSEAARGVIAAGGLLTVILGFAFREIGENLLAGLFLSFSPIFDVGDLIESNGTRGVVRRINIRDVHIRSSDGIDTFIPSAMIYKNQLHNYTRDGLRRARFIIGLDYKNDTRSARKLILGTVQKVEGVLSAPKASCQVSAFNAEYIEIECFFWINVSAKSSNLADIRSEAMERVREALIKNKYILSTDVVSTVELVQKSDIR